MSKYLHHPLMTVRFALIFRGDYMIFPLLTLLFLFVLVAGPVNNVKSIIGGFTSLQEEEYRIILNPTSSYALVVPHLM